MGILEWVCYVKPEDLPVDMYQGQAHVVYQSH